MKNDHSFFRNREREYFPVLHGLQGYDYVISWFPQIAELAKKKEG